MPTPGELVTAVSDLTGRAWPTVSWHDRQLAKEGLRSKGGRGNAAAKVTARDAVHLLIAICASEHVKDGPDSVYRYGGITTPGGFAPPEMGDEEDAAGLEWLWRDLEAGHTLASALITFLEAGRARLEPAGRAPSIRVTFEGPEPAFARIELRRGCFEATAFYGSPPETDYTRAVTISERTLIPLSEFLDTGRRNAVCPAPSNDPTNPYAGLPPRGETE